MNRHPDDDFERKLARQPWRDLPADWRGEILARCAAQDSCSPEPAWRWRDWLWPSPLAWGALAAVWLALLGLDAITQDSGPAGDPPRLAESESTRTETAAPPLFALHERQRALLESMLSSR